MLAARLPESSTRVATSRRLAGTASSTRSDQWSQSCPYCSLVSAQTTSARPLPKIHLASSSRLQMPLARSAGACCDAVRPFLGRRNPPSRRGAA